MIETNRTKDFVVLDALHVMIVQSQVCLHHHFTFVHNIESIINNRVHIVLFPLDFINNQTANALSGAACLALTSQGNELRYVWAESLNSPLCS